jgi:hypothetical protein
MVIRDPVILTALCSLLSSADQDVLALQEDTHDYSSEDDASDSQSDDSEDEEEYCRRQHRTRKHRQRQRRELVSDNSD